MGFSSNAYSSHYLAPLVPQGRGKKGWYGCNVELSLITRVLISRAHLVDANSRIITEGDQLRFHPCKNTPFHLLDVQKVGIKYVSRRKDAMPIVDQNVCVYLIAWKIGTEYLFCIYGGKKYENHRGLNIECRWLFFFFFFVFII